MKISGSRISNFLKQPQEKILGVLFFGPDQGLVKERSKHITKSVIEDLKDPFRVNELTPAELKENPPLLIDQASQLSFSAGKKVVRVVDANDALSDIFKKFLSSSSNHTLVVAEAGNLTPRSSLRKLFENSKVGAAIGCYEDDANTLESVIKETLQHFKLTVTRDVLSFLTSNLGSNRLVTRSELEKLALYVTANKKHGGEISIDDVIACIGDSAANSMDLLVYAMADGNLKALDTLLYKSFEIGTNNVSILRAVQRHLQNLHLVIGRVESGLPIEKAIATIRPPIIFKYKPQFRLQVNKWKRQNLNMALELITKTELNCKSTGFPSNAGCHRALMRIAQNARNLS